MLPNSLGIWAPGRSLQGLGLRTDPKQGYSYGQISSFKLDKASRTALQGDKYFMGVWECCRAYIGIEGLLQGLYGAIGFL